MRKRFIGLLVILFGLLIPVSHAATVEDYTVTGLTYYKDSNIAEVSVNKNTDIAGGEVIVAFYTEDNTFITYSNAVLSLDSVGDSTTLKLSFEGDDSDVAIVRAMVWDSLSTFRPLSKPKIGEITQHKYNADSDFAVAAAASNLNAGAIVDGENVYTLRVMKDGTDMPEVLNISSDVVVSYKDGNSYTTSGYATGIIPKGSAFFYTTDSYGLVDRIDIVLNGQTTFDAYRDTALTALVQTPDNITSGIINASDWYVNVNDVGLTANNKVIQLFVAPVMYVGDSFVSFSTMASDSYGAYVDTNVEYTYGIASDANIYYYDMSYSAPTNHTAFSGGSFTGIDLSDVSSDGKAYIDNVADEVNFDGLLQVAFVMAVDGIITNALVIGE